MHRERRKVGRRTQLRLQNPEKSSELKSRALHTLGGGPHSQSWSREVKGSHVSECWLALRVLPSETSGLMFHMKRIFVDLSFRMTVLGNFQTF